MTYDTPVKYTLTETTLIDNTLVQPGVVSFAGTPSPIFVPLCEEGEARREAFDQAQRDLAAANEKEAALAALNTLPPDMVALVRAVVRDELLAEARASKEAKAKTRAKAAEPGDVA